MADDSAGGRRRTGGDERRGNRPTRRREQAAGRGTSAPDRYGGPFRRGDDREGSSLDTSGLRVGGDRRRARRSDESIAEEIRESLARHPDLDATEVEVLVEGGEVTLTGRVEDRDARWLAEDIVDSVSGVSLVHNRLRVTST
jgi:hypothetical protein